MGDFQERRVGGHALLHDGVGVEFGLAGADGDRFARAGELPELLDPACEWVVQEEWTGYTEFLEQGCDAALFLGMHAMAGAQLGNMNHTVSGRDYQTLWFNGVEVGETGINAALCGHWGVPASKLLQAAARPVSG